MNLEELAVMTPKKFAIKIVLTATDTTNPPRVRNFRAIALQK